MIADKTPSQVSSSSISRYILFSINILSKESQCHWFSSSCNLIFNSNFNNSTVLSTDFLRISVTPINTGLFPSITHEFGEIDISQLVNAYKASIILSGDTPEGKWIIISATAEVLSSIFLIFILFFSVARTIESIKESVVVPNGIWLIINVLLFNFCITALTLTLPPLRPSLYWVKSANPPLGKSGNNSIFFPFKTLIEASISSIKLWGRILQARPTAIPSAPWFSNIGNFTGRYCGSLFLPS